MSQLRTLFTAWLTVSAAVVLCLAAVGCQRGPSGVAAEVVDNPAANPVQEVAALDTTALETTPPLEPVAQPTVAGSDNEQIPITHVAQIGAERSHPFPKRLVAPEFPKDLEWLNTSKPLTKADLKGKFVLFDFWTYCCINCIHILPELKKLEKEFPKQLVVVGVHSAKFENEKDTENIRQAVLRYEIEHPVVNDADHGIWDTYGINSWPTILLIDPEGNAVWGRSGEFKAEQVREVLKAAIPYYRGKRVLDEKPFEFQLEDDGKRDTPLRYPGKVLTDEPGNRLFISDSNHNRIVISTLDGQLLDVIGSGKIGKADGSYTAASFDHPQGCALKGEFLYVADTENHLIRKVDLKAKKVSTLAGTGSQAAHAWPGLDDAQATGKLPDRWVGPSRATALNSPWALYFHDNELYIAMAGPHQIWKMSVNERELGPYAGNAREDIVDGPLLPPQPYQLGFSSFAQPSGLSSDGTWLFVADSEGSSIRAVPFDPKRNVRTVVGTNKLDFGRLFRFGDVDGPRDTVLLQHCLEVVYHEGKLYVADTYNHKIKVVDAATGDTQTLAGTGSPGRGDEPAEFNEPAGLAYAAGKLYVADTNNSLLRVIDLASGKVSTLTIAGLTPPGVPAMTPASPTSSVPGKTSTSAPKTSPTAGPAAAPAPQKPSFKGALQEKLPKASVKAVDGLVRLQVALEVPAGWKMNPDAPMSYWLDATAAEGAPAGPVDRKSLGRKRLGKPVAEFDVPLAVSGSGQDEVTVSLNYYYCDTKPEGVCKVGAVVFTVPLEISDAGSSEPVRLAHVIPE
ncbi:MAG: redoxin domain-containing protein [Pirellulaceae bacterium]|jgi:DNA-binding beta-propeller fold protein YncE|nr:redoxin domain-containing protein [Pirellulaceae bacterium]